ncbi:MFS transporter [Bifidobacterium sp. MA2]|uniref:MFS transporter n=1 Tax=Bifidobacterium santillanense TaxID=2809028 RepID=A0ABS5UNZ9_9BIFI|nr:MFS transporter [Bifidobacterium santillanense]MBT1172592.1 MFS transporter [Bifidobacterium santillanense]
MTRDIAVIMAAAFFYMSGTMLATPLIVGYAHSLGAGGEFAGMIAGTMNIVSLFCRPWAGRLCDRVSLRRFAMLALALLIAANGWYACAPGPASVMAARIVNGVGFSCLSVCLAAWLTALIPLEHIGKGMGYYGMVNALAMALGPAAGIAVRRMLGYRAAFALSAIGMVVALALVALVRSDATRHGPARPARTTETTTLRERVERTISIPVIPVALVFMLFAIPYCATQSYIVTYVEARRLPVEVGLFFPLYAAALLVLRVAMRNEFDRRPFRWFLSLCAGSMLVSLGAMTVMRGDLMMLVAAVFMAASYGLMSSVSQSDAVRLAGEGHGGRGNATYYIGLDLGMALGPIIGGWLYANVAIAWFYPALMLTMPIAVIGYLIMSRKR